MDYDLVSTPQATPPRRVSGGSLLHRVVERGLARRDTPPPEKCDGGGASSSPSIIAALAGGGGGGGGGAPTPKPRDARLADGLSLRAAGRWLSSVGRTSDQAWLEAEHRRKCGALRTAIAALTGALAARPGRARCHVARLPDGLLLGSLSYLDAHALARAHCVSHDFARASAQARFPSFHMPDALKQHSRSHALVPALHGL